MACIQIVSYELAERTTIERANVVATKISQLRNQRSTPPPLTVEIESFNPEGLMHGNGIFALTDAEINELERAVSILNYVTDVKRVVGQRHTSQKQIVLILEIMPSDFQKAFFSKG